MMKRAASRLDNPSYMGVENEVYYHMRDWRLDPANTGKSGTVELMRFRAQVEEEIRREALSRQFKGWGSHPEGVPF